MLFSLVTGEVRPHQLLEYLSALCVALCQLPVTVVCVFPFLQFPVPAEPDHSTMLTKVRGSPYVLPEMLSSALTLLLTEVWKYHSPLEDFM